MGEAKHTTAATYLAMQLPRATLRPDIAVLNPGSNFHEPQQEVSMPIGIVLSGGGAMGDFEVGALYSLYSRGVRPDVIAGTSVGAINGAAIAQGEVGLSQLGSIWFSLRENSDMYLTDISLQGVSDQLKGYLELSGGHLLVDLTLGMGPALPLCRFAALAYWRFDSLRYSGRRIV
jgi:predicted acylesterase/phospholipase RssA